MGSTKETHTSQNNYEEIAAAFSQNAASLLPEDCIQQTLEEEEKRFENASALQISPTKFIGGNTARHCKELLRRRQPFFPLYLLSSFLVEESMILLIYGLLFAGFQHFFIPGKTFTQPYPVAYGVIVTTGLLLYQYISRTIWLHSLSMTVDNPSKLLKHIINKRCLAGILIFMFGIAAVAAFFITHKSGYFQISILDTLILYATCAILAGIHNLVYDSHVISFLSVGAEVLNPRRNWRSVETATRYKTSSLQQILAQRGKELSTDSGSDFLREAEEILHSRLRSFRIYAVLASIILLALDCLCVYQLLHTFSLPLLFFSVMALLGTFLCVIVFVSSQTVIKGLY